MQAVDSRATEKQFHGKLDITLEKKIQNIIHNTLKIAEKYFYSHPSKYNVSYGGIAQQCTNLRPGQAESYVCMFLCRCSKLLVASELRIVGIFSHSFPFPSWSLIPIPTGFPFSLGIPFPWSPRYCTHVIGHT